MASARVGFLELNPWFARRKVYNLQCKFCDVELCDRAMKGMLLSDLKTSLFSTDISPKPRVDFTSRGYKAQTCSCTIRDTGCTTCGNSIGYFVALPCHKCLEACNNGHSWIFFSFSISENTRLNRSGLKPLTWQELEKETKEESDPNFEDVNLTCR